MVCKYGKWLAKKEKGWKEEKWLIQKENGWYKEGKWLDIQKENGLE